MKRSPVQFLSDKSKGLVKKLFEKYLAGDDMLLPITDYKPNDVFIVGYPKSGNTWMQSLITSLVFGVNPTMMPLALSQELVPDINTKNYYKRYSTDAFFKSHDLPQQGFQRVVYLVRDGRDAMLSFYHMQQLLGINDSLEAMLRGKVDIYPSSWQDHILAWHKNPYQANKLVIRYEDLLLDTAKELQRLCAFLEIERTAAWIEQVVEGNSFAKMKAKASKNKSMGHALLEGKADGFFRSGKQGNYKKEISEELLQYFNEAAKDALQLHNYL